MLVYVGAVVTLGVIAGSGGSLATTVGAVTLAGSGSALVGVGLAKLVGAHHARYLKKQMDRGGLPLWVRAWDKDAEQKAAQIMSSHAGHDVHAHILQSAA